jgi:hypothetical protein
MEVPYLGAKIKERKIGILDRKMNIEVKMIFEMTTKPRNIFTPPPPRALFNRRFQKHICFSHVDGWFVFLLAEPLPLLDYGSLSAYRGIR